jgi:adenine-specific DNA-methyltransferase
MKPLTAQDPETHSPDIVAGNVEQLKALFPEAFTEGKLDFEVLKQLLGGTVEEREEKYGLNWHGKRRARQLALTPSTGTLRPCPEDSVDWDTTRNLMIEGDNLEVLKLLQKSYAGKVKLIYIDPPYNTGKDFVYPDDFQDNIKNYLQLTGQVDGNGHKIASNTESSGRFHTDWLNMIYPRLRLARGLLKRDGVVFISIDDRELNNLRAVANEIFGEENHIATITVVNNLKGRNDKAHVAACHEYVVIYGGGPEFVSKGLPLTEEQKAAFKHEDSEGRKYALRDLRKRGGPDKREDRPNMFFPIYWNENTQQCSLMRSSDADVEILPFRSDGAEGRWRWGKEKVGKHIDWLHAKRSERSGRLDVDHRVYLDPSIAVGDALEEDEEDAELDMEDGEALERSSKPKSIWLGGEFSTDSGKRALKEIMPGESFNFPKSLDFLKTCIVLGTGGADIIADLFAGSGALGQAVMQQNMADGGNRRVITFQLPEPLDPSDKAQKAAAAICDQLGVPRNIAELTKERLRRAGKKVREENPMFAGDLGFRVFKLSTSNIHAWEPNRDDLPKTLEESIDHLKSDRTEQDILFELLLKLGLDLTVPMEQKTIAGKAVHSVGAGTLLACMAEKIATADVEPLALGIVAWHKTLSPAGDTTIVFRDSAFADDVAKTNLTAILQQHGLDNVRSL